MAEARSITLSYIDARPNAAARDLMALSPQSSAKFLQEIPERYRVKLFGSLSSWSCAQILQLVSPHVGSSVLKELPFYKATEILRLMPLEGRSSILSGTSKKLQRDFERSLAYPTETVGAVMSMNTLSVRDDAQIADAINLLKSSSLENADMVFVVSEDHDLLGALTAARLIKATKTAPVREAMDSNLPRVSARAKIESAERFEAWTRYTTLPVISRNEKLVGAVTRVDLARLDAELDDLNDEEISIIGGISSAFVHCGIEFSNLIVGNKSSPLKDRS